MQAITVYLLIINAISFLLMLVDKHKARKKLWRIPEATLLGTAAIGGSLGALVGMYLVRHKTRKPKFYLGIPAMLVLHCVILYLLYTKMGL